MSNEVDGEKWSRLLRGSLLSSIMSKNIAYVNIIDARARTLITICSVLVPVLISIISHGEYWLSGVVALVSCFCTLITSVLVLVPKKVTPHKDLNYSPLHFTSYSEVTEEVYLNDMQEIISDHGRHTELFIRDIYHIGRDVLKPKMVYQRVSYYIFLVGNAVAAFMALGIALT